MKSNAEVWGVGLQYGDPSSACFFRSGNSGRGVLPGCGTKGLGGTAASGRNCGLRRWVGEPNWALGKWGVPDKSASSGNIVKYQKELEGCVGEGNCGRAKDVPGEKEKLLWSWRRSQVRIREPSLYAGSWNNKGSIVAKSRRLWKGLSLGQLLVGGETVHLELDSRWCAHLYLYMVVVQEPVCWVLIPLISCEAVGRLCNFSVSHISHLEIAL